MWLSGQASSPVSPDVLGANFGPWAVALCLCLGAIGYLIRDRERERQAREKERAEAQAAGERADAERDKLVDRLLALSEKIEPLALRLIQRLEQER